MTPILISLAVLAAEPEPLRLESTEVGKVPRVSAPAEDLPLSLKAPLHGRWVGTDGHELRAGEFLPYPLDVDVRRRLRLLNLYPDLCQAELDRTAGHQQVELEHALSVRDAEHIVNQVDAQVALQAEPDWDWYHYVVLGGLGIVAALGGIGVGALFWR